MLIAPFAREALRLVHARLDPRLHENLLHVAVGREEGERPAVLETRGLEGERWEAGGGEGALGITHCLEGLRE